MKKEKKLAIALIDTGVNLKKDNIQHFLYKDNNFIKTMDIQTNDYHGTYCAVKIFEINKNVELIDICIADNNLITEEKIIKGIQLSCNLQVDIINISLKLEKCSNKLYEICKYAVDEKDIIIVAANDKSICYPACIPEVISVEINDQDQEIIYKNNLLVSVKKTESIFCLENKQIISLEPSESIATAFISGKFAYYLEKDLLDSNVDSIKSLFSIDLHKKKDIIRIELPLSYVVLQGNSLNFNDYVGIMNKSIKGEYILEGSNNILDADNGLLEINGYDYMRRQITSLNKCNKIYTLGSFLCEEGCSLNKFLLEHGSEYKQFMYNITRPIFMIASFGVNSGKFNLQVELYKQLVSKAIACEAITYNPLGVIFDFYVYKYPEKIILPDILYSINNDIASITEKNNSELLMINVPGTIEKISKYNSDFGDLFNIYLRSLDIDILILCVNVKIPPTIIFDKLNKIKEEVSKIFIYVNNKAIDEMSFESSEGFKTYPIGNKDVIEYVKSLREILEDEYLYIYDDLISGKLLEHILSLYG